MRRRAWTAVVVSAVLTVGALTLPATSTAVTPRATGSASVGAVATAVDLANNPFCPSWNGLHTVNPYASAMAGYVKISGFPTARVAVGGKVAWAANPFKNASWRVWFTSLKWVGGLVTTALGRGATVNGTWQAPTAAMRSAALSRAATIVHSYLIANPRVTSKPTAEQIASMGHRTQVLACLAEALGNPAWLVSAARAHAAYVAAHWKGAWNQGLEQDLGALAVGCIVGPTSIATAAAARMDYALRRSILPDGANNEQAPGYAAYSYVQWNLAIDRLQRCGIPLPTDFQRVPALATFVAHATQPDGNLVQIGDTVSARPPSWAGTATEYAASRGAVGTPPANRVGIYPYGGYVFGRSSWAPFTSASYYTLRFGPGTAVHGHFDHTQVTWFARGHHVLVDTGHIGYTNAAARKVLWQPAAHNVLTLDKSNPAHNPTTMRRNVQTDAYDTYLMNDVPTPGVSRIRSVLIAHDPSQADVMVVTDNAGATIRKLVPKQKVAVWRQHFHLPPGWSVAKYGVDRVVAKRGTEQITLVRVPVAGTPSHRSLAFAKSFQAPNIGRALVNTDVQFTSTGWTTRMVTVVVPSALGTPVSTRAVRNADGSTTLTVVVGASIQLITLDRNGNAIASTVPAPPAPLVVPAA